MLQLPSTLLLGSILRDNRCSLKDTHSTARCWDTEPAGTAGTCCKQMMALANVCALPTSPEHKVQKEGHHHLLL